ncbi:MAG TPA: pseudouridine synthase [Longimicrobiales bacterium]|nr:pseudouridine synthase [Longimicrobiales bacterium]
MAEEGVRLQKFLSQAGVASRRASEALITEGRVSVNGEVVTELGTKVDPDRDEVRLEGEIVRPAETGWFALHKPRGYLSTRSDPGGRATLYDLLPPQLHGLFYVGRLDYDSEGLVLLTNDGDTAHRMLHPRYGVAREYEVELDRNAEPDLAARLLQGVELEDGPARAEEARQTGAKRLRLVLGEGRKREVRRMLTALGHDVRRLRRLRYGPIQLGSLAEGAWRPLTASELRALRRLGKR